MAGSQATRIADRLRKQAESTMRMLALEVDAELRKLTPVATGHARRNWIPSVGAPHTGEVTDDLAHAQGTADLLAYHLEKGSIWVANVVPYIQLLNWGHSKQRPAGFVEQAIANALRNLEAKGRDVSSMRDAFARRHENAAGHGAAPDGADGAGWSGGEYA